MSVRLRRSQLKNNRYFPLFPPRRDKLAKVFHCSNVGEQRREWPSGRVLAFGNSPPKITLEKVKGGRKKFEDIVNQDLTKEELVSSLMKLLKDPVRYRDQSILSVRISGFLIIFVCFRYFLEQTLARRGIVSTSAELGRTLELCMRSNAGGRIRKQNAISYHC